MKAIYSQRDWLALGCFDCFSFSSFASFQLSSRDPQQAEAAIEQRVQQVVDALYDDVPQDFCCDFVRSTYRSTWVTVALVSFGGSRTGSASVSPLLAVVAPIEHHLDLEARGSGVLDHDFHPSVASW